MMSWRGGGCRPALWTFLVMGSKGGGAVGPVQQSSCLLARAPSTCARRIALHSWQVSRSVRQMHASSSLLFSSAEGTAHPASREAHDPSTRRRRRGKGVVLSRTEKKELYSTPRSHSSSNKGASLKQQEREEEEVAEDKEERNQEDNKDDDDDDDETKELITLWQEYARHKEKWPLIFSYLQGLQTEMERAERRGPVEGEEDNKRPGKQRERPLPPTFLVNLVLQQMVGRKNDLRAGVELVKLAKACGVPLSAATFSLLISAYGKAGQMGAIQRALQVMEEEGVPLNAFVYSALISAYAHAKDSEAAARYFVEMKQQGMRPDVVTYSALLNAFIEGQQLGQAESLLYDMKAEAEKTDDDTNDTNQKKKKKKQKTFRFDAHVYSLMRKLVARLRLEGEEERANDLIVDFDIRERSNNTTPSSVEEEAQEQEDEQEQQEQEETGESKNEKRE